VTSDCPTKPLYLAANDGGDMLGALIERKEKGIAPQQLIGAAYEGDDAKKGVWFRQPVYPYALLDIPEFAGNTRNEACQSNASRPSIYSKCG